MIYQPFTVSAEVLLYAIDRLMNGPPGLAVRMTLRAHDEPQSGPPRRLLQATLVDGTIIFDIIDGADLLPILEQRARRLNPED